MVKDKHKRELELKRLEKELESKSEKKEPDAVNDLTVGSIETHPVNNNGNTVIPMDIDDIPIPSEEVCNILLPAEQNSSTVPNLQQHAEKTATPPNNKVRMNIFLYVYLI